MQEKQYKSVYEFIPCPILILDENFLIKDCNLAASEFDPKFLPGENIQTIFPWVFPELGGFSESALGEIILLQKEAGTKPESWVELHIKKLEQPKKGKGELLLIVHDISEIKKAEIAIEHDQRLFFSIIEFLPDPTFVVDTHGIVIAWNRALVELTKITAEEMVGKGDFEYALPFYGTRRPMLIDYILKDIDQPALHYPKYKVDGDLVSAEVYLSSLKQEGIHLWGKATTLKNVHGDVLGAVETIRDISDLKNSKEQIQYLSAHDPVTGLYNRPYFESEIERLENGRRYPISILFCEIRSLKKFNAERRFPVDDDKVKDAAGILKACFRREDLVARLDSQNFGILMPASDQEIGKKAVQRVIQSVVRFNQSKPKGNSLQLSIGLSTAADSLTFRQAIKNAQIRVKDTATK